MESAANSHALLVCIGVTPYTGGTPANILFKFRGTHIDCFVIQHWKPVLVRLEMYPDNEVGDQRLSERFDLEGLVAKSFSNIRQKLTS